MDININWYNSLEDACETIMFFELNTYIFLFHLKHFNRNECFYNKEEVLYWKNKIKIFKTFSLINIFRTFQNIFRN